MAYEITANIGKHLPTTKLIRKTNHELWWIIGPMVEMHRDSTSLHSKCRNKRHEFYIFF